MRRTAAVFLTPVILTLGVAVTACSGSDGDDSSSFCEDRAELSQSIGDLRDLSVRDDGLDAVEAQLTTVIDDVETLESTAAELQPEVDAVRSSLDALRTSVDSASTIGEQATALLAGLDDLATTWGALDEAAGSECD